MLKPVEQQTSGNLKFLRFADVRRYETGTGCCFVYNAVMKKTKGGKPFVTLYLRDIAGAVIPGYIFDLASPLLAGGEAVKVIGQFVEVDWTENYLDKIGLTLTLEHVRLITNVNQETYKLFCGEVSELDEKLDEMHTHFREVLRCDLSFPVFLKTYSSPNFAQGRVGGLVSLYYQIYRVIKTFTNLPADGYRRLLATFVIYISVHSAYVRAEEAGKADITLVSTLTSLVSRLAEALKIGPAAMEVIHIFFGHTPEDIYVRTLFSIVDMVIKTAKEFEVYATVPLMQEGNAGYGTIKRFIIEEQTKSKE